MAKLHIGVTLKVNLQIRVSWLKYYMRLVKSSWWVTTH